MISSKHCENNSSLTGQMPLSRAYLSISFWSSISLRRATSTLEAGWWLTYWMKCFPDSTHSLGGRIALRMSSLDGLFSIGGNWFFLAPKQFQIQKLALIVPCYTYQNSSRMDLILLESNSIKTGKTCIHSEMIKCKCLISITYFNWILVLHKALSWSSFNHFKTIKYIYLNFWKNILHIIILK